MIAPEFDEAEDWEPGLQDVDDEEADGLGEDPLDVDEEKDDQDPVEGQWLTVVVVALLVLFVAFGLVIAIGSIVFKK